MCAFVHSAIHMEIIRFHYMLLLLFVVFDSIFFLYSHNLNEASVKRCCVHAVALRCLKQKPFCAQAIVKKATWAAIAYEVPERKKETPNEWNVLIIHVAKFISIWINQHFIWSMNWRKPPLESFFCFFFYVRVCSTFTLRNTIDFTRPYCCDMFFLLCFF